MTDSDPRPSFLVVIPPPIWALLFVAASVLAGRGLGLAADFQSYIAGFLVFGIGFLIAASGRRAFARAGTEVLPVSRKNSVLVESGPFRFTRNPMYLGILIATIGVAFVIGTPAAFAAPVAFFIFVNFISIPYEERKMERQFGDAWRDYKSRVRRWI